MTSYRGIIQIALVLLIILIANGIDPIKPTLVRACEVCTFQLSWGSSGSGKGEFYNPQGIAVDPSGNVYVADEGNNRVEKFTSTGGYITEWRGFHGHFNYPYGIAVSPTGNVYVTDSMNLRVQAFNSSGSVLTQWNSSRNDELVSPTGIAVDATGDVYVAEFYGMHAYGGGVKKFNATGNLISSFGGYESGEGELNYTADVAVDQLGNVYVTDQGSDRVVKFTGNGVYVTRWGSYGSANGEFDHPLGIAVDSSGNVYVADNGNHRIQKFTSDGSYITQWSSSIPGSGHDNSPQGLAVDSFGTVYLTVAIDDRVERFGNASITAVTSTSSATSLPLASSGSCLEYNCSTPTSATTNQTQSLIQFNLQEGVAFVVVAIASISVLAYWTRRDRKSS